MEYRLDGYCGLYCGACSMVLQTKAGTAEKTCYGCKSESPAGHCATCAIKACAKSKGYEFCIECPEVKTCELMIHFFNDPQNPNGLCVMKNMQRIQLVGLPAWLAEQAERWRCGSCGVSYFWYDETCPHCGQPVASYKTDI